MPQPSRHSRNFNTASLALAESTHPKRNQQGGIGVSFVVRPLRQGTSCPSWQTLYLQLHVVLEEPPSKLVMVLYLFKRSEQFTVLLRTAVQETARLWLSKWVQKLSTRSNLAEIENNCPGTLSGTKKIKSHMKTRSVSCVNSGIMYLYHVQRSVQYNMCNVQCLTCHVQCTMYQVPPLLFQRFSVLVHFFLDHSPPSSFLNRHRSPSLQ